jgi:2-oxoisovalerate dehydrogenase E1 component beta subunit
MLISAIEDPNPVMVLVPKALMRSKANGPDEMIPGEPMLPSGETDARALGKMIDAPIGDREGWTPEWPVTAIERVPIGVAKTVRSGHDVSVFAYGRMVQLVKKAADELAALPRDEGGVDAEVIDLRSLHPYDWAAISSSIRKTGRAVFVNEDTEITNFGEHLIRRTVEELWDALRTPPVLEAGKHVPGVGLADNLENASVPGLASVKAAIGRAMHGPERPGLFPKRSRVSMDFTLTNEPPESIARGMRHR